VAARIGGAAAEVEPGDVTAAADVGRIAAAIEARHGRLDVLVANAGMNVAERDWSRLTPAAAEAVLDGNLTGPFLCALAALPIMRAQGAAGCWSTRPAWPGRVVSS
jgi:NAD(P)-dependent dehydrogenase (short-subunit alcohol dehydrogenase family)